jgi:hypothetical protein
MSSASNAPGAIDVESLGAVSFASASSVAMRESWSALSPWCEMEWRVESCGSDWAAAAGVVSEASSNVS